MDKFSISQLFLLFQAAKEVYCLDSLASHLAAAAGTKVKVFWKSDNDPKQWSPLGRCILKIL